MSDGFAPHVELERIYTLRELMTECRKRVPVILQELDTILVDPDIDKRTKLVAMDMALNRGFGKPRQHVFVSDDTNSNPNSSRIKVYIPDNGRTNLPHKVIDADAA
jgi:hypothetical protein